MLPASRTARSAARRRDRSRRAVVVAALAALAAPAAVALTPGSAAAAAPPRVTSLWLVDTDNGAKVAPLDDYLTVLDLPFLPQHLTVRAALADAASVRFTTSAGSHDESGAPYTMAGEQNGVTQPVAALSAVGTVAVDVTPYAEPGANGTQGVVQHRRIQLRRAGAVVNSTADLHDAAPGNGVCATSTGTCTLRAAVEEADARPGRQDVSIPAGTYDLPLGELLVTGDTGLWGHGRPHLRATAYRRVLEVAGSPGTSPTVQAEDLDLTGGDVDLDWGGVALVRTGRLELRRSDVHGGRANMGGGIAVAAQGDLQLSTTAVHQNTAGDPATSQGGGQTQRGGGVFSTGTVSVDSSGITDNRATFGGGLSNEGWMSVLNTSVMGNTAVASGGGLENRGPGTATMLLLWSTLTDNSAGYTASSLPTDLRGGGGLWNTGTLSWAQDVVAENDAPWSSSSLYTPDCSSPAPSSMRSLGTSLLGVLTDRCGLSLPTVTTLHGSAYHPLDPELLVRTGTPLAARVPLTTSPAATHAVTDPACPSRDVRGVVRTGPCWLGSAQG